MTLQTDMTLEQRIAARRFFLLDIETTGLDPAQDTILEVEFRLYNSMFELEDQIALVLRADAYSMMKNSGLSGWVSKYVLDMHAANGLWDAVDSEDAWGTLSARSQLEAFIHENEVTKDDPIVGASVDFDKNFMNATFPGLLSSAFSYRVIDVSTLKEFTRRWAPSVFAGLSGGETDHRTSSCLDGTVADLQHYVTELGE